MQRKSVIETLVNTVGERLAREECDVAELAADIAAVRSQSPEAGAQLDGLLLGQIRTRNKALRQARDAMSQLESHLAQMTAPPLYPAMFSHFEPTAEGTPQALVLHGVNSRVVGLAPGLQAGQFQEGDPVLLNPEMNVIVRKAGEATLHSGAEICTFERRTHDGRLVVKARAEEFVARARPELLGPGVELRPGDLLAWDSHHKFVRERMDRPEGQHLFLQESPNVTFADIGGHRSLVGRIHDSLFLLRKYPQIGAAYGIPRVRSILLHGPPGTGKTLIGKAVANALGALHASGRSRFINVKPGALNSMWFGQSENNWRELFAGARRSAQEEPEVPVVLFLDEVDAVAGRRGQSHLRVHDNVLTALAAELDGLEERGNILVIATTNRLDALDEALLRPGRLGDLKIEVPRPGREAAREIFLKHFKADYCYARNGHGDDLGATRAEIMETVVSRIYAPNAESELATITFRDTKRRTVRAPDIVNGSIIANIARVAGMRAFKRHATTGAEGLLLEDVLQALQDEFAAVVRALTPANCHHHLTDLPQDMDVVKVEPVVRKVSRPHRYLNAV